VLSVIVTQLFQTCRHFQNLWPSGFCIGVRNRR